jgi:hypothetical protein
MLLAKATGDRNKILSLKHCALNKNREIINVQKYATFICIIVLNSLQISVL